MIFEIQDTHRFFTKSLVITVEYYFNNVFGFDNIELSSSLINS